MRLRNPKAKGSRNERRSRKLYEAMGYTVIRSAGSLGPFDLLALGSTQDVLIQVKTNDWPGPMEMLVLREHPVPPHRRKVIHVWRDRQRFPDVQEIL